MNIDQHQSAPTDQPTNLAPADLKPTRQQKTWRAKYYYYQSMAFRAISKGCGQYAIWCVKYGYIPVILSILITIGLGVGLIQFSSENNVTNLWVEKDPELESNRKFYNDHYGGLERSTSLVISATVTSDESQNPITAGRNSMTKEQLRALYNISARLLSSDLNYPSSSVQVRMSVNETATAFQNIFSVQVPVSDLFKPGVTQPVVDLNFFAYGYQTLTACLAKNNVLFDPNDLSSANPQTIAPLPDKWGISQFPSVRNTPLDCFQQGDFDYPSDLKELDRVARSVFFAKQGMYTKVTMNTTAIFEICTEPLREFFYLLFFFQNYPEEEARQLGDQFTTAVTQYQVDQFATWGYSWRRSFESFVSDTEIIDYIDQALLNARNESVTPLDCMLGQPCCKLWNGLTLDYETFLGDIRYDAGGKLASISYLRTGVIGANKNDAGLASRLSSLYGIGSSDQRASFINKWEQTVIDFYIPMYERIPGSGFADNEEFSSSTLNFYTDKSSDDVAREGNNFPTVLTIISYVVMIVYASLTFMHYSRPFGWKNVVYSRLMLGILGIVSVGAATICGFGLLSWANVAISPVGMNLAPFLCLGIGQDDTFVILNELLRFNAYQYNVEERMKQTMEAAGASVLLTSWANIVAFFIASSIDITALRVFCLQIGITMTFNIFFIYSIFVPLVCWDCKRVAAKRLDLAPWVKRPDIVDECKADAPDAFTFKGWASETLGRKILLRNWFTKVVVLLSFIGLFIPMTIIGFTETKTGLPLSEVAMTGSYQASYVGIQEIYFTGYKSYLVSENVVYDDLGVQQAMLDQQVSLQNADYTSAQPTIRQLSWLAASSASLFYSYNAPRQRNITSTIPTTDYYPSFFLWVQTAGTSFTNDLWCFNETAQPSSSPPRERVSCVQYSFATLQTKLAAARQEFIQAGLFETEDFVKAIKSSRDQVDDFNINGNKAFVYGYIYEFWEQYVNIWSTLYRIVGFCILGVLMVALLITFSLWGSLILVCNIFIIILTLFGLMTLVGIRLNAVSVTNYAIAVGMSVEFTSHIFMAFRASSEKNDNASVDRNERANAALGEMFLPSLHGMLTTNLALIPIVGSEFEFIRKYYFGMLFTMTFLAFLNGMMFLPVVISLIGPKELYPEEKDIEGEKEAPTKDTERDSDGWNPGTEKMETDANGSDLSVPLSSQDVMVTTES